MNLFIRLIVSLSCLLLILSALLCWQYYSFSQIQETQALLYKAEKSDQADSILKMSRKSLESFVYDYSWWDDMIEFTADPSEQWWNEMMEGAPEIFNAQRVWVFNKDFELVYSLKLEPLEGPKFDSFPLEKEALIELFKKDSFPTCFVKQSDQILLMAGAIMQSNTDIERVTPPEGYFIADRIWDAEHIYELSNLIGSIISLKKNLTPTSTLPESAPLENDHNFHIYKTLPGWNQEPIAQLNIKIENSKLQLSMAHNRQKTILALVTIFAVCIACLLLNFSLVIYPLYRAIHALRFQSEKDLHFLSIRGGEWKQLSELIGSSFTHQLSLKKEIEERKRIEADLKLKSHELTEESNLREQIQKDIHDDIIQSLYALGLRLELIVNKTQPQETKEELTEVKSEINQVIRNVRNFISGLAPEALQDNDLEHAIQLLVDKIQKSSSQKLHFKTHTTPQDTLTRFQKVHIFHICHELLSNAIRHAEASNIYCSLIYENAQFGLIVKDDGVGFINKPKPNHGLSNIQKRAEIIRAKIEVHSNELEGSEVRVYVSKHK